MGEAERSAETQGFARLMRELKERAGLSYGTLARRLHTSTSTLHRYCNGEAVPTEFAAVDRFARACGAAPADAVELHRAWLLADARRRALARALPQEAEPEAEAEPVAEVPEQVVAAVAGSAAPGREPAPRRPWYRRREAVVAAAGLTAGAVAVAVLAAAGPGRHTATAGPGPIPTASAEPGGSAAGATGATGPGTGPGTAPGTAPTGATASASNPGAEPGAGPGPGAGAGPGSGASAAGTSAPAASSAPGAVPLRAAVRTHVWTAGCDHAYLSAQDPRAVPAPPVEADAPAWAAARAAVHAGTQIVEVTLHGTGSGTVVLQDLEVRVAARRTPPAWNVYQMSQGCGGGLTPAGFAVNLDAPRPLARPVAGNDAGDPVPAPAFPLRVSAAEPVVLRVEAVTTGCDCDWSLDLRWSGPAGSGTLRIDDGGRPLRTSAAANRPVYGYATEQGRWAR
ncbi:helix-turn-helix transcriptional regulator [Streptomyces sp. NPDC051183]|uniref:helix-turn-helix domain-containing protein n=1 Tax=Streptomyces sp. NPDC051183 TaxID=3155165 RepID=UPI00343F0B42